MSIVMFYFLHYINYMIILQDHEAHCPDAVLPCSNECGLGCKRRDLDDHLVTCPQRLENCPYCQSQVVAADITVSLNSYSPRNPLLVSLILLNDSS